MIIPRLPSKLIDLHLLQVDLFIQLLGISSGLLIVIEPLHVIDGLLSIITLLNVRPAIAAETIDQDSQRMPATRRAALG